MKYLIDGYNVIFECGLHARQVNSFSLAKARTRLLQTISALLPADDLTQTTVVFDAQKIPLSGQTEKASFGGITVLYSINYEDADSMIEELIAVHSASKNLVVVSSDQRLRTAASRRKSISLDSQSWYDELTRSSNDRVPTSVPPPKLTAELTEAEIAMLSQAAADIVNEEDGISSADDAAAAKDNFNPFPDAYFDDLLDDDFQDFLE